VVGGVVGLVDVVPTLLNHLSVAPMEGLDGEDLGVYWRSEGIHPSGAAYSESLATRFDWGWSPLHSMRSARYHFVRAPRPEIYDVGEDPHQLNNRFDAGVAEIRSSALALDRRIQEILDSGDLDHTAEVDGDTLQRLRALGYAIPDVPPVETGRDPKDGLLHARELVDIEESVSSADWERAESLIRDHLTRAPGSARARLLLAAVHLYTRRWDEALKSSELIVLRAPWSIHSHLVRAEILIAVGRMEEALASLERARNIEPTSGLVQANGMFEAFHAGDPERAFAIAGSLQSDFGYDTGVHQRIGDAFKWYGEYDEARKAYLRSVEEQPANQLSQMLLAIEWARAGHAEEATRARGKAGPYGKDPWLSLDLAMGFEEASLRDAAQAVLDGILASDPDFDPAMRRLEESREPR
jgi:tetratricopeptide (TPR) repeat protein